LCFVVAGAVVGGASVGGAQVIKDTRPSQAEIYAKAGISADELQREGSGLLPAEPAAASPGAEHKLPDEKGDKAS